MYINQESLVSTIIYLGMASRDTFSDETKTFFQQSLGNAHRHLHRLQYRQFKKKTRRRLARQRIAARRAENREEKRQERRT
jgi:hypothetical protein